MCRFLCNGLKSIVCNKFKMYKLLALAKSIYYTAEVLYNNHLWDRDKWPL